MPVGGSRRRLVWSRCDHDRSCCRETRRRHNIGRQTTPVTPPRHPDDPAPAAREFGQNELVHRRWWQRNRTVRGIGGAMAETRQSNACASPYRRRRHDDDRRRPAHRVIWIGVIWNCRPPRDAARRLGAPGAARRDLGIQLLLHRRGARLVRAGADHAAAGAVRTRDAARLSGRTRADRSWRPSARIAVLGVVWLAVPLTLFPFAEERVSSSVTGMLNGATPLFVAIVATMIARRPPPGHQLVGLLVGFAGVVVIALPSLDEGSSSAARRGHDLRRARVLRRGVERRPAGAAAVRAAAGAVPRPSRRARADRAVRDRRAPGVELQLAQRARRGRARRARHGRGVCPRGDERQPPREHAGLGLDLSHPGRRTRARRRAP